MQAFVDDLVGFSQPIATGEGIDVVRDVFVGHAADDTADEATARQAVHHGELFRGLHRMTQRQDIADHSDLHPLCAHDDGGRGDIARRLDIDPGEVMLVDEGAVEAEVFAHYPLVEMLLVGLRYQRRIAEPVGEAYFRSDFRRDSRVGQLVEGIELHRAPSCSL
jgi:hypothetical protein